MAGIWVNGAGETFPSVPGFYAVLASHPFRAIATEETLKALGIGYRNLDFARGGKDDAKEAAFRSAVIRLKQQQNLFQEHDDGVSFIGRSLFRASVDLPVNVPIGRYTANVYLFRDGQLLSKNHSTLEVSKAGLRARDLPACAESPVPLWARGGGDRRAGRAARLDGVSPRIDRLLAHDLRNNRFPLFPIMLNPESAGCRAPDRRRPVPSSRLRADGAGTARRRPRRARSSPPA